MKKIKIGILILTSVLLVSLILSAITLAKPLLKQKNLPKIKYVQDEIIVKFKGDVKPFRVIKVPEGRVLEEIEKYRKKAEVVYAEPNYLAYALWLPNDPYYKYQWHMDNPQYGGIQMEEAWDLETGSASIVVAIVDTGIAYEDYGRYAQAPDLAQTCFVPGYDFVNEDNHPNDDNRHGTHVAGTVAQSTNNALGVTGVAFNTCLMPVKVLDRFGQGTYAEVAAGIRYAADNGAQVINLSLGGSSPSLTLEEAVAYAYNKGVTVVAAAGNEGLETLTYPAAYDDYVIAVGATRYDETLADYSNYGPSLDLVAPGGDLNVDQNNDGYGDGVLQQTFRAWYDLDSFGYYFFQGTSCAAPHVAGVAALLLANGNATTPDQIRAALQETAEDLGLTGRDDIYGYGLIDASAALQWTAGPVCSSDTDCDDANECTNDSCLNPGTAEAYCLNTAVADETVCSEGICCSGECVSAVCSVDLDCNDNDTCTIDTCLEPGTCAAACSYETITACIDGDGCCPAGCDYTTDSDCPEIQPMHVASIEMELVSRFRGWLYYALATVTILDADNNPVEGATVSGHWQGATTDTDSGVTDANGQVTFQSDRVWRASGQTFTFCVDEVTKTDWTYDSSANLETCDSITAP